MSLSRQQPAVPAEKKLESKTRKKRKKDKDPLWKPSKRFKSLTGLIKMRSDNSKSCKTSVRLDQDQVKFTSPEAKRYRASLQDVKTYRPLDKNNQTPERHTQLHPDGENGVAKFYSNRPQLASPKISKTTPPSTPVRTRPTLKDVTNKVLNAPVSDSPLRAVIAATSTTKIQTTLVTRQSLRRAAKERAENNISRNQAAVMAKPGADRKKASANRYAPAAVQQLAKTSLSKLQVDWLASAKKDDPKLEKQSDVTKLTFKLLEEITQGKISNVKQEWLHLVASYVRLVKLGQTPGNLVCATEYTNTEMLAMEKQYPKVAKACPNGFRLEAKAYCAPGTQMATGIICSITAKDSDFSLKFIFNGLRKNKPHISATSYMDMLFNILCARRNRDPQESTTPLTPRSVRTRYSDILFNSKEPEEVQLPESDSAVRSLFTNGS